MSNCTLKNTTLITVRFVSCNEDSDSEVSENEMQSLNEKGEKGDVELSFYLHVRSTNLFHFSKNISHCVMSDWSALRLCTLDVFEIDEYDDVVNTENPVDDNQSEGK